MALNIQQIRERYPDIYNGISDRGVVAHLQQTLYPELSFDELANRLGYQEQTPVETAEDTEGDGVRGFKNTFRQVPQFGYGLLAAGGAVGEKILGEDSIATGIKKFGVEGYNKASEELAKHTKDTDSVSYSWEQAKQGNLGALVDWMQYGIGYAGGQGLQMLATAGLGSAIGKATAGTVAKEFAEKMVAKEAAKIATTEAAKTMSADAIKAAAVANVASKIGETAALGAAAIGMEGGEIGGDLVATAEKEGKTLSGDQLAQAFGATLGAGSLEFIGDKLGLDVLKGKSKLFKMAESMPDFGGKAVRGALAGTAVAPAEGATEYGQTLIEEWGKGNDPFSAEAKQQATDAAWLGALGGGAMGGVGGLLSTAKPIADAKTVDEAIEAAGASLDGRLLPPPAKGLNRPDNRGNISPDTQIVFADGSATSAYDYFAQRMDVHGDENLARQETFQALNGPIEPIDTTRFLTDSGVIFSGQDNPLAGAWKTPTATGKSRADAIIEQATKQGIPIQEAIDSLYQQNTGYVPGQVGELWETPTSAEDIKKQVEINRAFFEKEQAELQAKADAFEAMAANPDASPAQVKQYRKKRAELEQQKRQRAEDFRNGLGFNVVPYKFGEAKNNQLADGLLSAYKTQPDKANAPYTDEETVKNDTGATGDNSGAGGDNRIASSVTELTNGGVDVRRASGDVVQQQTPDIGSTDSAVDRRALGPNYQKGFQAAQEGQPRTLPSKFKNPNAKAAQEWLKGYDEYQTNQAQSVPPDPATDTSRNETAARSSESQPDVSAQALKEFSAKKGVSLNNDYLKSVGVSDDFINAAQGAIDKNPLLQNNEKALDSFLKTLLSETYPNLDYAQVKNKEATNDKRAITEIEQNRRSTELSIEAKSRVDSAIDKPSMQDRRNDLSDEIELGEEARTAYNHSNDQSQNPTEKKTAAEEAVKIQNDRGYDMYGKSIEQQKAERQAERKVEQDKAFNLLPISVRRAVDYKAERDALGVDHGGYNTEQDAKDGTAYANFIRTATKKQLETLRRYEQYAKQTNQAQQETAAEEMINGENSISTPENVTRNVRSQMVQRTDKQNGNNQNPTAEKKVNANTDTGLPPNDQAQQPGSNVLYPDVAGDQKGLYKPLVSDEQNSGNMASSQDQKQGVSSAIGGKTEEEVSQDEQQPIQPASPETPTVKQQSSIQPTNDADSDVDSVSQSSNSQAKLEPTFADVPLDFVMSQKVQTDVADIPAHEFIQRYEERIKEAEANIQRLEKYIDCMRGK